MQETWTIVDQIQRVQGVEIPVQCKVIRYYPYWNEEVGEMRFKRLKKPTLRILVQHKNGQEILLSRSLITGGMQIKYPPKMRQPYLTHAGRACKDRQGRPIVDKLAEPVLVPGEVTPILSGEIRARFGNLLGEYILKLFKETAADVGDPIVEKELALINADKSYPGTPEPRGKAKKRRSK